MKKGSGIDDLERLLVTLAVAIDEARHLLAELNRRPAHPGLFA